MGKSTRKKPRHDDPEVYHVEVITRARVVDASDTSDDGSGEIPPPKWEYYVKWAGYDSDANSWEPEANVAECSRLLASFWKEIGMDDSDYAIGHVVKASEKWIKKEKKFFATEFSNAQEEMRRKRAAEERERTKKLVKKKPRRSTPQPVASSSRIRLPTKQMEPSDSDDDDKPLMQTVPAKRKRVISINSDNANVADDSHPTKLMKTENISNSKAVDKGKQKEIAASIAESLFPSENPTAALFSEPPSPEVTVAPPLPPPIHSAPSAKLPLPSKKAPSIIIPPKIRRPTDPHANIPRLAPEASASGSGISTKARLAQGALNPTNPRAVAPPAPKTKPPPPPQIKTNPALMSMGFKKTPLAPGPTMVEAYSPQAPRQEPTLAALNSHHGSPSVSPMVSYPEFPFAASPVDISMRDQSPFFNPHPNETTNSPITLHQSPGYAQMDEAEMFLRQVIPPMPAASSIAPIVETNRESLPSRAPTSQRIILPHKIPKVWKWLGPLRIDTSTGPFEHICDIIIADAYPEGLNFKVAMAAKDHLHVLSFHDTVDLDQILLACNSPQQLARLGPQEDKDTTAFTTLVRYMVKKQKIILNPLFLDGNLFGHMLLYPSSNDLLNRRFKVPKELLQPVSLVAALIPWILSPLQMNREWRIPYPAYLPAANPNWPPFAQAVHWKRSVRRAPLYQCAIRILKLPLYLHQLLAVTYDRPYCIWGESGGGEESVALETKLLRSILAECKKVPPDPEVSKNYAQHGPRDVGLTGPARIVFVHVGALKTLHQLPKFVKRRSDSPEVLFCTFGTHESVLRDAWGMCEIYSQGGIVTFSPAALVEDPIGVRQKIRQIAEHNFWECYILPSVLGMAAKMVCKDEDPLAVFDRGDFLLHNILLAIEEGDIALMCAPPDDSILIDNTNHRNNWIMDQVALEIKDARAALEFSVNAFNHKFSNIVSSQWNTAIEAEISTDLTIMERQPAIMKEYRRFITVIGSDERHIPWDRDGLEWVTLPKFDFKDTFHLDVNASAV